MGSSGNDSLYAAFDDMSKKKKNQAAVSLGQKRWKGVPADERTRIATRAIKARWAKKRKP